VAKHLDWHACYLESIVQRFDEERGVLQVAVAHVMSRLMTATHFRFDSRTLMRIFGSDKYSN